MTIQTTDDYDTAMYWLSDSVARGLEGALHFRMELSSSGAGMEARYFLAVFDPRNITHREMNPEVVDTKKVKRRPLAFEQKTKNYMIPKEVPVPKTVDYVAYTDGGCWPNPGGPGGVGVVLLSDGRRTERGKAIGPSTNNAAELMAVREALLMIPDRHSAKVTVMSDSQYAIGVIHGKWIAKANKSLINEIRTLSKECAKFKMLFVRGHSGVVENEAADRLASEAVERGSNEAPIDLWSEDE